MPQIMSEIKPPLSTAQVESLQKEMEMLKMENAELVNTNQHLITATFRERDFKTKLQEAHDELNDSKRVVEKQNQMINDSINYAHRIQTAIVPSLKQLQQCLPNSGIFFEPKHVLSGDFPWIYEKVDDLYVAAVDCTGHGVPGAMLSLIGNFKLQELVQMGKLEPSDLLNLLHSEVQKTLNPQGDENVMDGMDVAMCRINYTKMEFSFAGAHRPVLILDGDELTEIKGARRAIGGTPRGKKPSAPFQNHKMPLKKGMRVFIYSDGLPDQLNEEDTKKFSNKQIKNIILENKDKDVPAIINEMEKALQSWKGEASQLDDILFIGFEV